MKVKTKKGLKPVSGPKPREVLGSLEVLFEVLRVQSFSISSDEVGLYDGGWHDEVEGFDAYVRREYVLKLEKRHTRRRLVLVIERKLEYRTADDEMDFLDGTEAIESQAIVLTDLNEKDDRHGFHALALRILEGWDWYDIDKRGGSRPSHPDVFVGSTVTATSKTRGTISGMVVGIDEPEDKVLIRTNSGEQLKLNTQRLTSVYNGARTM